MPPKEEISVVSNQAALSDQLSMNTLTRIGTLCSDIVREELETTLKERRQSLLSYCAPEIREVKCWQAAHETLLTVLDRPTAECKEIWDSAQFTRNVINGRQRK